MLDKIHIKNFAIIDSSVISFEKGFNVISGETGAGKSILIDALGLQLGDRADSSLVRNGEKRSEILSEFTLKNNSKPQDWLQENDFDEDLDCQLRRTLTANGKSKCFINSVPTTVSNTKIIGEMLVDIHGQHSHQSLTSTAEQINILDDYANHNELLNKISNSFSVLQELIKKQQKLQSESDTLVDRLDLLKYKLTELKQLNLEESEFKNLEEQHKTLTNSKEILEEAQKIIELTSESEHSLENNISQVMNCASKLNDFDSNSADIFTLVEQAQININELQSTLDLYLQTIDISPEHLQQVDERMSEIYSFARKYRIEPSDLLSFKEDLIKEIEVIESDINLFQKLDEKIINQQLDYKKLAEKLSKSRENSAKKLTKKVNSKLAELNMSGAVFSVQITETKLFGKKGLDKIIFMFAPNVGQGEKPLHKIASGGELSRISLAIQVASVNEKTDKTLIFDEVDSGIGGATAEVVARMLKQLSCYNQIICITHLPQVAAFSDQHLLIEKQSKGNNTFTKFKILNHNDKVMEIARMSGGININNETIDYAKNMINNATIYSKTIKEDIL